MSDRLRELIVSEPWRTAAVLLAVALLVSLFLNFVGSDTSADPDPVAAPSTTSTSFAGSTTTTASATDTTSSPPPTVPQVREGGALVAIKVDNAPGARPQVGIGEAPILIEYPVEGGITRFAAVFPRESTGIVGPIRSLRPLDADLFPAIAPIVVSSGGQPFVVQDVDAAGINSIVAGDSSMFVSLGREAPHDTFVDMATLGAILDDSLLPAGGGLPTDGPLPEPGSAATQVESPLGATFEYDPELGYVRFEDGQPFEVLDLNGEGSAPLSHDTLVFLFAAERSAGYTDSNGVPVSTFDVIGSGDLLVFHEGQAFAGSWARSALEDPFVFTYASGEVFGVSGRATYTAVLPRTTDVTFR